MRTVLVLFWMTSEQLWLYTEWWLSVWTKWNYTVVLTHSVCLSLSLSDSGGRLTPLSLVVFELSAAFFLPPSPTTCSLVEWLVSINRLIKEYVLDQLNLDSAVRWLLFWIGSVQIKIDWFNSCDTDTMYIYCYREKWHAEIEKSLSSGSVIILCHTVLHQTTISCIGPHSSKLN